MNEKSIKVCFTAASGFLSAIFGTLYIPVMLMILCNIIDYITGLIASKYRQDGGISSYRALKGVYKKITMWLLVVVGAVIDNLIGYAAQTSGFDVKLSFLVAGIVAIWIICNEIISILENMIDIGIDLPKFLLPLVKSIKSQAERIAERSISENNKKDGDNNE